MLNSISSVKRLASLAPITMMLLATACGGAAAPLASIATAAGSVPGVAGTPAPKGASTQKAPAQAGKPTPLANCQAIVQANYHFGTALAQLVNLTASTDYDALTRTEILKRLVHKPSLSSTDANILTSFHDVVKGKCEDFRIIFLRRGWFVRWRCDS